MVNLIKDLKEQIIAQLNLQDISPDQIDENESLFGGGLGLDSIDALEIIALLQQKYNITISRAEDGPQIFTSVKTLAAYIHDHQLKLHNNSLNNIT